METSRVWQTTVGINHDFHVADSIHEWLYNIGPQSGRITSGRAELEPLLTICIHSSAAAGQKCNITYFS